MKHKNILIAFLTFCLLGIFYPSTKVLANKSSDIYMQGYETKHPRNYFKKWTPVVLTDRCLVLPHSVEKGVSFPIKYLKSGTLIKLKSVNGRWRIKGPNLPLSDSVNYWYLPQYNNEGDFNDRTLTEDGYLAGYNFVKLSSYSGNTYVFAHKRKVKVTKNVRADHLKLTTPLAYMHSVKHKIIKKGTILTVGAPTNHWQHEIWGKGLKNSSKYIWVIDKLNGWYKFID
ncbi:hypothetical protein [Lactobacillus sp. PV012]|uniref:hypothetical protein n=1 Tax=Lactobacillus sp. PV012 TaxID=2594494 RepID=UPI00223FCD40|nr:hypothetical protein [Lactobacillus sp. PV012]QNQ82189.1 hypothetical protein FP433_03630 [Lactobacillus sp. PV012]